MVKQHIKIIGPTEVEIGDIAYKFRHPDAWTVEEVCDIEDAATVYDRGVPRVVPKLLMQKTLAKAVEGMTEAAAIKLPMNVGKWLYEIVRWQPVPLPDSPSSN